MPNCALCGQDIKLKYVKKRGSTSYSIFDCELCRLWQLFPIPSQQELDALYANEYFKKRTDRGYDDYLSHHVGNRIFNTLKKNLNKLNFYTWEKKINSSEFDFKSTKTSLDIGCAAGYFVEYMKERGWESDGIDIAPEMVVVAKKKGLHVQEGNFLDTPYPKESYDLITLWASLEHLSAPHAFIKKIYDLLKPGGHVYISTCHLGFWARIRKQNWRFLNVPEHIWFFSRRSLHKYFSAHFFRLNQAFTYGSGFTTQKKTSFFYHLLKKIADFTAKYCFLGDMIVCDFVKEVDKQNIYLKKSNN